MSTEENMAALANQVAQLTAELTRQAAQIEAAETAASIAAATAAEQINGPMTAPLEPRDQVSELIASLTKEQKRSRADDLGRLGRPSVYDPLKGDWHDWEFTFLSYLGVIDEDMVTQVLATRYLTTQVPTTRDPEDEARARRLFYQLVLLTTGSARKIVRNVGSMDGYEAYRLLSRQFGTGTLESATGLMIQIMQFNFGTSIAAVEERLTEWTVMIGRYDTIQNVNVLPDELKRAVLIGNLPEPLRTHLQLNAGNLKTFQDTYQAATEFLRGRRVFENTGSPTKEKRKNEQRGENDMDVDAVFRRKKGKGKGKNKGDQKGKKGDNKGKAKTKDKSDNNHKKAEYFAGFCRHCKKWGHKAVDCWYKPPVDSVEQQQSPQQQSPEKPQVGMVELPTYSAGSSSDLWIFMLEGSPDSDDEKKKN